MLFKDDYAFGTAKEDDVLTKINKHFKYNKRSGGYSRPP
jgi:hypothetical protein